jgi:hypothetical protein
VQRPGIHDGIDIAVVEVVPAGERVCGFMESTRSTRRANLSQLETVTRNARVRCCSIRHRAVAATKHFCSGGSRATLASARRASLRPRHYSDRRATTNEQVAVRWRPRHTDPTAGGRRRLPHPVKRASASKGCSRRLWARVIWTDTA